MFHIARVEIDGFWGKYQAAANFHPSVNILIGKNGSGKTNFMNLLEGVLRVDLRMLGSLEFRSIVVKLRGKDKSTTRTITVTKDGGEQAPYERITYKIGRKSYMLNVYAAEVDRPYFYAQRRRLLEGYTELQEQISELVSISSLSVHRAAYEPVYTYEEEYRERRRSPKPPIDERLEELVQKLTRYQLTLAESAAGVSARFQGDVLASMLYDEKFDKFGLEEISGIELSKEKEDLSKAYKELRVWNRIIAEKIENHVNVLNRSLAVLGSTEQAHYIDDIMPLPLLRRTQHIIALSRSAEQQKQQISRPISQFLTILREFVTDKQVSISPSGDLIIQRDNRRIPIAELSSGEKQLLILLTETLLQENKAFIFLADEPELSLHIEWQAKIIESMRQLNPNSQIIVATHSPEIAGGWKQDVIDMEDVIDGWPAVL